MESIIIIVHVIAAIGIIGLVLIQHGKGADMGASFGSGSSQTMFGSMGSGNALTKSTTILASIFFITSLGLAVLARQSADLNLQSGGLLDDLGQVTADLQAEADSIVQDVLPEFNDLSDIPTVQNNLQDVSDALAEGDLPALNDMPAVNVESAEVSEE